MEESRLRWFRNVRRRLTEYPVRRVDEMEDREVVKGKRRPRKTIHEVVKQDLWCGFLKPQTNRQVHRLVPNNTSVE
ncbi:hypothetical protein Ahy_A06g028457 [Arachis hypogaea]|uniref:Uncharacterized protein n=1 Tax=Arachis hypogaea TaxID=3818 RepID=A0A445CR17_ARAHY|nr:hypothetical protein Ahy_A06g028457 [Arachis hypogaea]